MNRLVVNPGTPQSLEIQLKPGTNSIGRGAQNDSQISDGSVSGSHCQIVVSESGVIISDLGSTNGTFVNQKQIQQAVLEHGQALRLGNVEMIFYSAAVSSAPVAPPLAQSGGTPSVPAARMHVNLSPRAVVPAATVGSSATSPVAPVLSVAGLKPPGLRLTGSGSAETAVATEDAPSIPPIAGDISSGPRFCKFHPRSPARFLCRKCNRIFCDLCVSSRASGNTTIKTCRSCGVECQPLQVNNAGLERQRGFFAQLPGAFIYPFKGTGLLVLIAATIVFAALSFVGRGLFGLLIKMAVLGYLFSYMQNIIHATAAEEQQMPGLPDSDGLFGAFFTLVGTVIMSFGLAIGLLIAKFNMEGIPVSAIIGAVIFGCLYLPMAFLATAMKDTAIAANPLVVIPAIVKVPLEYLVTVILMSGIFGIQQLGDIASGATRGTIFTTRSVSVVLIMIGVQMCWSLISLYLLTVNMRILGLLYVTKKDKLEWF